MREAQYLKLHKACVASLEVFRSESQATINLLGLAIEFPQTMEKKTAVIFQHKREDDALIQYHECRRQLFDVLALRTFHA